MAAYVIAQLQIHDLEKYREYASRVPSTVAGYGARFLVSTDTADVREGAQPYPRTVIAEFPTMDAARAWYESDGYQVLVPLRQAATTGTLFMVEGFTMPTQSNVAPKQ